MNLMYLTGQNGGLIYVMLIDVKNNWNLAGFRACETIICHFLQVKRFFFYNNGIFIFKFWISLKVCLQVQQRGNGSSYAAECG